MDIFLLKSVVFFFIFMKVLNLAHVNIMDCF